MKDYTLKKGRNTMSWQFFFWPLFMGLLMFFVGMALEGKWRSGIVAGIISAAGFLVVEIIILVFDPRAIS